MPLWLASTIVLSLELYLFAGALFALVFLSRGVGRTDERAEHATWAFTFMIAPGTILLWPLLALRWQRSDSTVAPERIDHRAPVHGSEKRP